MAQFCAAATGPAGRFAWSIIPPPLTGGAVVDLDIVLCRQLQQLVHAEGARIKVVAERGDQHASLRGLISTWLEIAVNALLSLDQDDGRRVWIVLDELPTLHQVPSLQPGLAESRQFGGCFVLGIQVISALRDLYGRNGAETISGLCGTRVVLSAPDEDTARWSAASLGRTEVEEVTEGFSYGANTIRDGVSLTPRRELRPLALASEIMQLPSLHGYLRFPGPLPAARIALDYVGREPVAERFVARRGPPTGGPEKAGQTAGPREGMQVEGGTVQGELALEPPQPAEAELTAGADKPEVPGTAKNAARGADAAGADDARAADESGEKTSDKDRLRQV